MSLTRKLSRLSRTVGVRMTLWNAAIFGVAAVLVCLVAFLHVQRVMVRQTDSVVDFRLQQFAAEYGRGGKEDLIALCNLRRGRAQKAFFVRLGDASNNLVFLRDAEDWMDFKPRQLDGKKIPSSISWQNLTNSDGEVLRLETTRLGDGSALQVGKTLEDQGELLVSLKRSLFGIVTTAVMAAIPLGALTAIRALRPIQHVTATVDSILETGKFSARVPSRQTGDEIDELVRHFNTMLDKIEALISGMRESLENVAHDLRTPMTRLRNVAISALERDCDKAACHEALSDCLEESERLTTMLITLMDISEAETGVVRLEKNQIDVRQLIQQSVDLYEHVAEEKGTSIDVAVNSTTPFEGDASRLQRALSNLLDNAIKYSPDGGAVTVRAWQNQGFALIEVADNGEGIPPEEQARIWERLYRVDKSRSQRGLGLGLSFVKAIVEAHGGTVEVRSLSKYGSCFTVKLPVVFRGADNA